MVVYLDLETFGTVDIKKSGAHKYTQDPQFKILLVGYAIDNGPVCLLDWQSATESQRREVFRLLEGAREIVAHNAQFERLALRAAGLDLSPAQFTCTFVRASYCGLPLGLDEAAKALGLQNQKLKSGTALINYFCTPRKTTAQKTLFDSDTLRNLPEEAPEKWEEFKDYLRADVEACRELYRELWSFGFTEKENYILDQKINDRGVLIDKQLAKNAQKFNKDLAHGYTVQLRHLTGLDNPNSDAQLKAWLSDQTGEKITNLAAEAVKTMEKQAPPGPVKEALRLRMLSSNRSVKKYDAALHIAGKEDRARGLLQFYGSRTGRWSGRGIQPQNMPRNYMNTLETARKLVKQGDFETLLFLYDDPQQVVKELLRTMIAAPFGCTFLIADFAAIEARVLAWMAGEKWRLEVFKTHGKIYEASASAMFGVPLESITKGSEYRSKGKIAELALGYQGGRGALESMGGADMGLSPQEMQDIVKKWRRANPAICSYWSEVEDAAINCILKGQKIEAGKCKFYTNAGRLIIELPSGRPLIYHAPEILSRPNGLHLIYQGQNQATRQWGRVGTYGGKITENIVQAVARDLLAYALQNVEAEGFKTVLHVHDEIIAEHPETGEAVEIALNKMLTAMTKLPEWATGLPLGADGFTSPFYIKD